MKLSRKIFLFTTIAFVIVGYLLWNISKKDSLLKKITATESQTEKTQKKSAISINERDERISLDSLFLPSFEILKTAFPNNHCDISTYGAVSGGEIKNTESFQKAIADCAKKGGGTVFVPEGSWLTGAIRLESNINLHLDAKAEIIFTQSFEDYLPVVFTRFEGVEIYNFSPPIYARDAQNIAITGKGKINGNSKNFWWEINKTYEAFLNLEKIYQIAQGITPLEERRFGKPEYGIRPNFIELINCDRILIEGVQIIDGSMWTIHPVYSQNILIRNISIETHKGKNTDGVVIDSSKNALIEDSFFSTGDDAIAIKSGRDEDGRRVGKPSENIVARNIRIDETHAGLAIGSEVSGGIRNVFASNFSINNSDFGFRIKSNPSRGGKVEGIHLENFQVESSEIAGFEINLSYGREEETGILPGDILTDFNDISIENFSCQNSHYPFFLRGREEKNIEKVSFKNIEIRSNNDARIYHTRNALFENLNLIISEKEKLPKIKMKKSQEIFIKNSAFDQERIDCQSKPCNCSFER